ncbi:S9 family peptidase [Litchfieldia salsa]|uniref:Dipeptidyl aminopeptidase/acylaminoacyl peptidase n=1 Tax=Litchfieldia salsa TaxID=930152 RepID=A0A1H0RTI8_9BACI|nr:alpha/beta fold hydrolase [Litchfieldia salsa]SDP32753.1 Dipeptidyl aminopeptidase/acylaminoacyl peptidase [Litchfieldia salsa]
MIKFDRPSIDSFFRTLNILDFDVDPSEEKIVYSTNLNGYYNLWGMNLKQGYPYQLTTVNQMNSFVKFDPNGKHILTGYDTDGDEDYHIYALPTNGGETTPLLKTTQEKYYFGDLSEDGQTLYYTTSVDNPNYLNIERLNLVNGKVERLVTGEGGPCDLLAVSPDETTFAYTKAVGNTSEYGYLFIDKKEVAITPSQEEAHRVQQAVYFDHNLVLMLTNYQTEFSYLATYSISERKFEKLIAVEGHELSDLTLDKGSNKVYFVAQRGVEDSLYEYNLLTKELNVIKTPFDIVDRLVLGKKGSLFALGRSSTLPANLFRYTDAKAWVQLSEHKIIGVSDSELIEPEVFTYSSYDGLEIEGLFYSPNPENDNGYTILWPHGGPQHAIRKNFSPLFQYLCTQGYRVFSPNFRGSTGYGESFMKLVNKDWGGGPRLDILTGMDWLDNQDKSTRDKWFCIGGSYGGYMTLLLHGRHPDRFNAFVDIFGPSNLFTTIETAPEHWKEADRELIGDSVVDRDKLIEDSPMTYIDQMTKPMLVIQGKNDPRVVKIESDVIVQAMQERGQDIEYLVLEDEGHGFSKTENAIRVYKQMVDFLNKYLK